MPSPDELRASVFRVISALAGDKSIVISDDTPLLGDGNRVIDDSLKMVELCMQLEELAREVGFTFKWTLSADSPAYNKMFLTAGTLSNEFVAQMESAILRS